MCINGIKYNDKKEYEKIPCGDRREALERMTKEFFSGLPEGKTFYIETHPVIKKRMKPYTSTIRIVKRWKYYNVDRLFAYLYAGVSRDRFHCDQSYTGYENSYCIENDDRRVSLIRFKTKYRLAE